MSTEFAGTERFEIVRRLGAGGMGVVYEAIDREKDTHVALKTLKLFAPEALLHLKREFRALQDIYHPNLVSLGELIEDAGQWFFTMELVEGSPFISYVDKGSRDHRLRRSLGQLAKGLNALHGFGKIHRDIKPSNVLVDADGRVVILDFGLVREATELDRVDNVVVGTAAYMAPEQATGGPVGPPADWYAVGVLLYRALTGSLPFRGKPIEVLRDKQRREPKPPGALAIVPEDLESLCVELLRFDPAARPTGDDVLMRLDVEDSHLRRVPDFVSSRGEGPFVGRQREMLRLEDALRAARGDHAVTTIVHGRSGVGKSTLVRRFVSGLGDDMTVLRGRCYEREWVPFKAFDDVADNLAHFLRGLAPEALSSLLPDGIAFVGDVFPVLRRVEGIGRVAPADRVPDPQEQRSRVFQAMRQLIFRIAERVTLVLVVDDMQWADADSLALLTAILSEPFAPRVLFIATERDAAGGETVGQQLAAKLRGDVRRVHLEGLPHDAAVSLARELIERHHAHGVDPDAVALEAEGHPLFIDALVRHRAEAGPGEAVPLDDALWARVTRLKDDERKMLSLLAVAGAPLPQQVVADAAIVDAREFARLSGLLRVAHLVRTTGSRLDDNIDCYHDRIREAICARLQPEAAVECHLSIADALELSNSNDWEALLLHYRGGGRLDRAAESAVRAADQASASLAFVRAARLYQTALSLADHLPHTEPIEISTSRPVRKTVQRLRVAIGDCYANAGHGAEAGDAYLAAAEFARSPIAGLELRRRAAEEFMRAGRIDPGLEHLSGVLTEIKSSLPRSHTWALIRMLAKRLRIAIRGLRYKPVDESELPPAELMRVDAYWTASTVTAFVDTLVGAYFNACHLLAALDVGEPFRVSRALVVEAAFYATKGEQARDKLERLRQQALEVADNIGSQQARGFALGVSGLVDFSTGRWRQGVETSETAIATLSEHCAGVSWELNNGKFFASSCLVYMGRFSELRRRLPAQLRSAQERGDWYASCNLRTGIVNATWLAADDPATARAEAEESFAVWSTNGFHMQHVSDMNANALIDLYVGDPEAAHRRVEGTWPALARSFLLRVEFIRVLSLDLRGKSALGAALTRHRDKWSVKLAAKQARKLRKEKVPWAHGLERMLSAGICIARDDLDTAKARYADAAAAFDGLDMAVHAAVARRRLGQLMGGPEGARIVNHSDLLMQTHGIDAPDKFAAIYAPFPAPS